MMLRYFVFLSAIMAVLCGCQSAPESRYTMQQDTAPAYVAKKPETLDAVPKYDAYRQFNSRPYEVLGQRYSPLASGKGFEEIGYASWYGQKFHGHLTSNGETYNMFAMTAAHKTLPLPSYVRVTNLENGQQAIVRVNDRGPFHDNRIVDLSYAAAVKLGYQHKGTAKVKIEVIHFDQHNNVTVGNRPTITYDEYLGITVPASPTAIDSEKSGLPNTQPAIYIQVAALSDEKRAKSISNVLSALYQVPTHLPRVDNIYKLQLGPIENKSAANVLLEQLRKNGYPNAYTVEGTL